MFMISYASRIKDTAFKRMSQYKSRKCIAAVILHEFVLLFTSLSIFDHSLNMRRQAFTAAFKLKVIQVAKADGNRAAGKKFDIAESNVRHWRAEKAKLEEAPRH